MVDDFLEGIWLFNMILFTGEFFPPDMYKDTLL